MAKVGPGEYADNAIRDGENSESSEADFANARPSREVSPGQRPALMPQAGRPRLASPKVHIGLRLAADVVNGIRASGRGYNARVERALRDALESGRF